MKTLRRLAWAEGISFLLLLGVAMPLKYAAGRPFAVTLIGWIHGALFVALLALAAIEARREGLRWLALVVLASLLPFGPFLLDHRLFGQRER